MSDENDGLPAQHRSAFSEALGMWNRHEFYESHEVLEEIWGEDDTESAEFVQGLLCAAVGFAKLDVDRPMGTVKMMTRADLLLQAYRPSYMGIDLEALLETFARCRVEALKVVEKHKESFDRTLIPRLEPGS